MAKKKDYSDEFKANCVKLIVDGVKSANKLSKEVGVPQTTLSRWVREALDEDGGKSKKTSAELEVQRLQKKLKQVEAERDFLRSAARYFAERKE